MINKGKFNANISYFDPEADHLHSLGPTYPFPRKRFNPLFPKMEIIPTPENFTRGTGTK